MDLAHLHLMLNHFPIIGTVIGIGLLGYGIFRHVPTIVNAALAVFVAMSLITIPAFMTGESAEESVEMQVPGISHDVIHEHEEAAELALWPMMILGALSLFILWKKREERNWAIGALVLSLAVFGLMARTANLGGEIRHTEIRDAGIEG